MQCGENLLRFEPWLDTPAGGLAAWWRIETWAREEGIGLIPGPGRRCPAQSRAKPGKSGWVSRSGILIEKSLLEMKLFFYTFS